MPESDETQKEVKEIKWHLENLDNKVDMLIRGNQDAIDSIADLFRGDPNLAKVYLAINGERTQSDIVDKTGISSSTVSRKIKTLDRTGLVQKKEYNNGLIYKKDDLHDVLRLETKVDPETGWND